jgi:hypothetical protein
MESSAVGERRDGGSSDMTKEAAENNDAIQDHMITSSSVDNSSTTPSTAASDDGNNEISKSTVMITDSQIMSTNGKFIDLSVSQSNADSESGAAVVEENSTDSMLDSQNTTNSMVFLQSITSLALSMQTDGSNGENGDKVESSSSEIIIDNEEKRREENDVTRKNESNGDNDNVGDDYMKQSINQLNKETSEEVEKLVKDYEIPNFENSTKSFDAELNASIEQSMHICNFSKFSSLMMKKMIYRYGLISLYLFIKFGKIKIRSMYFRKLSC